MGEVVESRGTNSSASITAYTSIPYSIIREEIENASFDLLTEFADIIESYNIYKEGMDFVAEGTLGDYTPSELKYRIAASLINKQSRFLFGEEPDIKIELKKRVDKITEEDREALSDTNDLISDILEDNMMAKKLLQGAKDCFIGKRICIMLNLNEEDGATITFLPATNFVYETSTADNDKLRKIVAFSIINASTSSKTRRILKKKYEMGDDGFCYVEELVYDGMGSVVEEITPLKKIKFKRIPAVVIMNDGLTGETTGESDIQALASYEQTYSKLSNADIDAEHKSMNPIKYTVDMDSDSTGGLSTAAGSYWDLSTDQNADNVNPSVGTLESNLGYSEALKSTLDRIKTSMYEQVEMPNITLESMNGVITSGKALKSVYWPLIVRCKEKMKTWGPQLEYLISCLLEGIALYPKSVSDYLADYENADVKRRYKITVSNNYPLPEDEIEEKQQDIIEVEGQVMSKKRYMKKWYDMTDADVDEELKQIAKERELLEDSATMPIGNVEIEEEELLEDDLDTAKEDLE